MTRTYDNGWHSGDTIREDVTNHYNNLVHAHERLHKEIEQCQHDVPDTDLKHLKIKKLRLKDELQRLKTFHFLVERTNVAQRHSKLQDHPDYTAISNA